MGAEIHPKEIRGMIGTLMAADFIAGGYTENYLITTRRKVLRGSSYSVFITHYRNARLKKAHNELDWSYEYHIYLSVRLMDPDDAQDALDLLVKRAMKSLESHRTLGGYIIDSKEEVYNAYVSENDEDGGRDAANGYIKICRTKFIVQTSLRGA